MELGCPQPGGVGANPLDLSSRVVHVTPSVQDTSVMPGLLHHNACFTGHMLWCTFSEHRGVRASCLMLCVHQCWGVAHALKQAVESPRFDFADLELPKFPWRLSLKLPDKRHHPSGLCIELLWCLISEL